jgi:hypothetical protein
MGQGLQADIAPVIAIGIEALMFYRPFTKITIIILIPV